LVSIESFNELEYKVKMLPTFTIIDQIRDKLKYDYPTNVELKLQLQPVMDAMEVIKKVQSTQPSKEFLEAKLKEIRDEFDVRFAAAAKETQRQDDKRELEKKIKQLREDTNWAKDLLLEHKKQLQLHGLQLPKKADDFEL